jgi:hypothetical protein
LGWFCLSDEFGTGNLAKVDMNKRLLILVFALSFVLACHRDSDRRVVILNNWWTHDWASNNAPDAIDELRDFEDHFAAEFASDPGCRGISLIRMEKPAALDEQSKQLVSDVQSPWWLVIDYRRGESEQEWEMNQNPDSKGSYTYRAFTAGKGNAGRIAHTVCEIVKGTGGALED